MTENNLLEELREYEGVSLTKALADIFGPDYLDNTRCVSANEVLCAITDRIEREFVPISQLCPDRIYDSRGFQWPLYEDGTPVKFGDEFVSDTGKKTYLTSLELSCGGYATLNRGAAKDEDRLSLWDGDRVRREEGKSDQEALDMEARMDPRSYCAEILNWDLGDILLAEHDDMRQAMIDDLMRRQREILTQKEN